MKILVLGASGMLGNTMIRVLSEKKDWEVFGTVRSSDVKSFFSPKIAENLLTGVDVECHDTLIKVFGQVKPNVVINCIGLIKHLSIANDPLLAVPINTLLPHRLARLCETVEARLVHISTDCVFNGQKGGYTEEDPIDAQDLYGLSKYLGEVDYPHSITLRTSIIGHELKSANGLIGWFLEQEGKCQGFTRAIFSGLPTVVLAHVARDLVIPNPKLHGLYHVAAEPISKFDLLQLVAKAYSKSIEIIPDDSLVIDRSLIADRFHEATAYVPPQWPELVSIMHSYR